MKTTPNPADNKDPTPRSTIILDDYDKNMLLSTYLTPYARIVYFHFTTTDTRNEKNPENKDPTLKSRLPEWSRAFLLQASHRTPKGKLRFVKQRRIIDEMLKGRE